MITTVPAAIRATDHRGSQGVNSRAADTGWVAGSVGLVPCTRGAAGMHPRHRGATVAAPPPCHLDARPRRLLLEFPRLAPTAPRRADAALLWQG